MATGRRGPAPEPAAVKKAKGNSGRRPMKAAEIEEQANAAAEAAELEAANGEVETRSDIQPPDWLSDDGKEVWADIAPRLAAMKILTKLDAHAFARYCKAFARWVSLEKVLDEQGTTYESESPHGKYQRSHPAFMQADRLNRTLISMEGNFGLNPADRQRLFAARAAAGNAPGLFDGHEGKEGSADGSPIGLLN